MTWLSVRLPLEISSTYAFITTLLLINGYAVHLVNIEEIGTISAFTIGFIATGSRTSETITTTYISFYWG